MNFKGYQVPNLSKAFKKLLSNSVVFKTKDRSPSPITHHPSPMGVFTFSPVCFHVFLGMTCQSQVIENIKKIAE